MIAAGIVTFNPDIERLSENIEKILPQVMILFIVDNASQNFEDIYRRYGKNDKIFILSNSENYGIARALNQIINLCEGNKIEWVITLDQDSVVPCNIIEEFSKYIALPNIALITPNIVDRNYKDSVNYSKNSEIEYIEKCITSASLTNVPICKELGYFDENMFIDLVDFEYCIRVIKEEYKILKVPRVKLLHQLGNLKIYSFLGIKIYSTNHSPLRNYYFARNSIYFLRKHSDRVSKNHIYLGLLKKILKNTVFEYQKFNKLKAVISGIIDGYKMQI